MTEMTRRDFIFGTLVSATVIGSPAREVLALVQPSKAPFFKISLAQWSFHRALQSKQMDHLDFAQVARKDFGIEAVEYVNQFFMDKAKDQNYLAEMNRRASGEGVYQHLIMCDGEGRLGDPDEAKRREAVENHYKWVEAARTLGCATIRVNAASDGSFAEQQKLAADGLRKLCEYADKAGINVIVENHGGLSSHGDWLVGVMKMVAHPRCGTLPDFGNFTEYDRYRGVTEMMPFAKAVSAKSYDFDAAGAETRLDYRRLLKTVVDAGYRSWVGIEYEGERLPERAGVAATLRLLERVRSELSKELKQL